MQTQLCESTTQNEENKVEDDVYNRIMGVDTKSGGSLIGLYGTPPPPPPPLPSHVEALKMVEEKNAEVVEMKERLASVEQTCSQMAAQMSQMLSMMATMQKPSLEGNVPNAVSFSLFIARNSNVYFC